MISQIKTFLRIAATVKNWPAVSVAYFLPKKEFFGVFRNGNKIRIFPGKWKDFMNYVSFFRIFPLGEIKNGKAKIKYGPNDLTFNFGKMGPCVLNEVFGEENFITQVVWKKTYGGGSKIKYVVDLHEYIVCRRSDYQAAGNQGENTPFRPICLPYSAV